MRDALTALPGVRHVTVNYERKQAVVRLDTDATVDSQQMIAALEAAGFGGSLVGHDAAGHTTGSDDATSTGTVLTPSIKDQQPKPSVRGFASHVSVETFLDRDGVQPGESFRVAVVVSVEDGWHIYGNPLGPGVGQPTVVSVEGQNGLDVEPVRYAPAVKHEQDFGDSSRTWVWEYQGRSIHFLSGRVGEAVTSDSARLLVRVKGQVCNTNSCLPGTIQTELAVPVVSAQTKSRLMHEELFQGIDLAQPPAASVAAPAPGLDD